MLNFSIRGYSYEVYDDNYTWQEWVDSGEPGSEDFSIRRDTVTWEIQSELLMYADNSEVLPDDFIVDWINNNTFGGGGSSGGDAGTTHKTYVGVSSKARNIKGIYVGVGGKARKVKKVYVGVDGKARLCWEAPSSGGSSGGGTTTPTYCAVTLTSASRNSIVDIFYTDKNGQEDSVLLDGRDTVSLEVQHNSYIYLSGDYNNIVVSGDVVLEDDWTIYVGPGTSTGTVSFT